VLSVVRGKMFSNQSELEFKALIEDPR